MFKKSQIEILKVLVIHISLAPHHLFDVLINSKYGVDKIQGVPIYMGILSDDLKIVIDFRKFINDKRGL